VSRRSDVDEELSWRDRLTAIRYVPPFVKLVWQTHPRYAAAMVVLGMARAFIPVAVLWVGKLIVDTVVAAQGGMPDFTMLWKYVALEIALVMLGEGLARASALVEQLLGDLFFNHISVRLMQHAAILDLSQLEDPVFYDNLERARRLTSNRTLLLAELLSRSQDALTLASLGVAFLVYNPWLLLLLVVAVMPSLLGESHFAGLEYSLLHRWTSGRRQLDYLRYVGASDVTAKEVQLFGLAPWLIERFRSLSTRISEDHARLAVRRSAVLTSLFVLGSLGYYGAYAMILVRAMTGAITVGSLIFLAGAFARSRDILQRLLLGVAWILERCLYIKDLFDFLELKPSVVSRPGAAPVPRPIREGFVFEDVGFRYPGSDHWAVRHVDFRLRPGDRTAFVGENGAGKTTLIKLLARLYDPVEGRILLDGIDLREYELSSVRRSIGVIFQDFQRYDMRFDENIGVGGIDQVRSYLEALGHAGNGVAGGEVPRPIVRAAERSRAASLLGQLCEGYRQMLGRRFEGGVNLSGGEWQKVALARAYMRDAQVLILDEPTASLDARAEYEVFLKFSELVAARTAVIISHRFSTVRMADRIVVLRAGAVVESGSHAQLLAQGGLYSELFSMQAEGYR
jgi:ATP-binding cassette, subfamily B, bacterial